MKEVLPWNRLSRKAVRMGLISPSWFGYRWMEKETVYDYLNRKGLLHDNDVFESIHKKEVVQNPLPCNIKNRSELPDNRGWWGYSFWDVPARTSGETFQATLPDCQVVPCINPNDNQFWVSILNNDERSLEMDQISFRPWHADILRSSDNADRINRATWILERVFRNHSHWLTAHLPKLLLLKERNELENVIFPPKTLRTPVINSSLQMLGINPDEFRTFNDTRPLKVDQLTVLETDRFRPELLLSVRKAFSTVDSPDQNRRIYISREKAQRRQLLNEKDVWPMLKNMGFEKILMEELSFPAQVSLMQQAEIVVAPHGAAITNVIFCQPGTHVVEIADLSFPNPNFYALASAMGHHYWIIRADGVGDVHPLEKDLRVNASMVNNTIIDVLNY